MSKDEAKSAPMKVFIADDSMGLIERLLALLSEIPGIEVVGQAHDAPEALAQISKLNPDVVLLDIQMPGGGGIRALRQIKQRRPAPIVLMLTNYSYQQYRQKCMESGADLFLDKSRDSGKLKEIFTALAEAFSPTEIA